ncbi:MAG: hypothetical protein AAGF12_33100 [Myxococcota bacterium]
MQIPGSNVASEARAAQSGAYAPDDSWVNITLQPGFRVWRGVGGRYTPFHFGPNDIDGTLVGTPRRNFWEKAQVSPSKRHGFRQEIAEYEVMLALPAAHGLCDNSMALGWGGAEQYFIPEAYADRLAPTGARIQFR